MYIELTHASTKTGNRFVPCVVIMSAGSGYTTVPTITIAAPTNAGGTQAKATALVGGTPAWKLAIDPRTNLLYLATDDSVHQRRQS